MNSYTAYNELYDNDVRTTTVLSYWSNSEALSSSEESPHATCEMFQDSQAECDAIIWCKYVSSVLSIFGCIFTLFVIWLFRKDTEFAQRLIANLSVAALICAVAYVISEISHLSVGFCKFQAAMLQYSFWAVMLWYMCIVYNLLSQAVWERPTEKYEKLHLAVCWGFPFLMTGLPFIDDIYGWAGSWCWMKNDWKWRFGTWYIWSILSIVLVFILMVWILFVLHKKPNFHSDIKALRLYPVVYFLVNVFPVANRVHNAIMNFKDQEGYVFPLLLLQTISGPLLGVANAVVFVLDRPTIDSISYQAIKAALIRKFDKKSVIHEYPIQDFEINIVRINSQSSSNQETVETI